MATASRLRFVSKVDDYTAHYNFNIELIPKDPSGKVRTLSKHLELTEVYDEKGHQHRYVLKKFLEEALTSLEDFQVKKK